MKAAPRSASFLSVEDWISTGSFRSFTKGLRRARHRRQRLGVDVVQHDRRARQRLALQDLADGPIAELSAAGPYQNDLRAHVDGLLFQLTRHRTTNRLRGDSPRQALPFRPQRPYDAGPSAKGPHGGHDESHSRQRLGEERRPRALQRLLNDRYLLALLLPGIIWFFIYRYLPMLGLLLAFKDFSFSKGIFGSRWVGWDNFYFLFFQQADFYKIVRNTLLINLYRLVWSFPAPIVIALLLNELRAGRFKKFVQTAIYIPHFVSWVIFGSIVIQFLSPSAGIVNALIKALGGQPIFFMTSPAWFRPIVVVSDIWKNTGWGTIIYLAALAGVDPELYDAAKIDGANRWDQIWHVTLPSISETIVFILLLNVGRIMMIGFDQIYVLYNPTVYDVGDVISTYVYRIGIGNAQFSITTAIGLFQSLIGLLMIYASNFVSQKLVGKGIW